MQLHNLRPQRARFESGLRALVAPMPWLHRAVVTAHLNVGSRYESDATAGISHFLEHMLFRGTPRHPSAHRLAVAFEDLGGTLVAATAADHGMLAIGVPPENLSPVLELFAEVFTQPILEGLDIERGIVREEILEDLDERGRLIDGATLLRDLSFGAHGLGRRITGDVETLESFTREALQLHHAQHYVGAGTVVSVAGAVEPDATLSTLERVFAAVPAGAPVHDAAPEPQTALRYRHVQHAGSQTSLHLGFRSAANSDPVEPALEMLLRVIDDGMATRLYHRLCDSRGLCYDAGASYEAYADAGLVEISTETAHDSAAEVLEQILQITADLADQGPTADEMDRAQRRCRWQYESMLDDVGDVAEYLALAELTATAPTPADRVAQLSALTRNDVHAAAQRVFRPENLSLVTIGQQSERARARLRERAARS